MAVNNCTVTFAPNTLQLATPEQIDAVTYMASSEARKSVAVFPNSFDLPDGYLTFWYEYQDGSQKIYGGIAPDGSVST